jgi:hypothetical protein
VIHPWHFHSNPEAATDNSTPRTDVKPDTNVAIQAHLKFDKAVTTLEENGIRVHVLDDFGETVKQSAEIVPLAVPTIELAGGSARCMLAGIHLTPRNIEKRNEELHWPGLLFATQDMHMNVKNHLA